MIIGVAHQLLGSGLAGLQRAVPTAPTFYLFFLLLYLTPPASDWLIFRKIWLLPAAGFAPLLRKRIANDVLFGYAGDAYFYAWARSKARGIAAPFAGVKDVGILSAMAGNAVTLTVVAAALPFAATLLSGTQFRGILLSGAIVVATSIPFLLFRRRVFSLGRRLLWWVFAVQVGRIVLVSVLLALTWASALPDVAVATWLMLAAARLLVSRLPLVPNKDLLFANAAILLLGRDDVLVDVLAVTAALTLGIHVALLGLFGLAKLKRVAR